MTTTVPPPPGLHTVTFSVDGPAGSSLRTATIVAAGYPDLLDETVEQFSDLSAEQAFEAALGILRKGAGDPILLLLAITALLLNSPDQESSRSVHAEICALKARGADVYVTLLLFHTGEDKPMWLVTST